jgi:hypothetical protein
VWVVVKIQDSAFTKRYNKRRIYFAVPSGYGISNSRAGIFKGVLGDEFNIEFIYTSTTIVVKQSGFE